MVHMFNMPHFCACTKPETGFPMPFLCNSFTCEVIVHLVDIGGIVDHHCLHFLDVIRCSNSEKTLIQHHQKPRVSTPISK